MTNKQYYNFLKDNLDKGTKILSQLDIRRTREYLYFGTIRYIDWPSLHIERDDGRGGGGIDQHWNVLITLSNCKWIIPCNTSKRGWDLDINTPEALPMKLDEE